MSALRADGPSDPGLPANVARRLSARVTAHSGMILPDWVLAARVRERMSALSLRSPHDYAERLESARGYAELDQLLELLRVGETRFFRHQAHVQTLIDTVIPALRARRSSGPIRAWSAGCASGEEAYTLAMVLADQLPEPGYQISVLATDVSARAIATARRGVYPASAIAKIPARWRERGFESIPPHAGVAQTDAEPDGKTGAKTDAETGAEPDAKTGAKTDAETDDRTRVRVAKAVARLVTCERRNLLDGRFPSDMDIIWCRNVFIYFSPEARTRVARRLAGSLAKDGVLFIGYSESLRDVPEFAAMRTPSAVIYRRAPSRLDRASDASITPPRANQAITQPIRHVKKPAQASRPDTDEPRIAKRRPPRASQPPVRTSRPEPETTMPLRAPAVTQVRLTGRYDGSGRMATELSQVMSGHHTYLIIDLDGIEFISDEVAPLLRRASNAARAAGTSLTLCASRTNIVRFLQRHRLPFQGGDSK